MTDVTKLKPCPFCGGEAALSKVETPDWPTGWKTKGWAPRCESCGAELGDSPAQEQAAEAWNRRAALSGTREAVKPVAWVDEFTLEHLARRNAMATTLFSEGGTSMVPLYRAAPPSDPVGQGAVTDWLGVARSAGKHGVRYRTNKALEAFLADTAPFFSPAPEAVGQGAVTDWVDCPICGEPDMRMNCDEGGATLIHCVNHLCKSNVPALSPAPEAGSDEVERLTRERDEWRAAFENNVDSNVRRVWKSLCDLTRQQHQETKMLLKAAEARETDLRDQLGKTREALAEPEIERRAKQAANAIGVTPHSDMRLFVEQAVKYALATLAETQEAGR